MNKQEYEKTAHTEKDQQRHKCK